MSHVSRTALAALSLASVVFASQATAATQPCEDAIQEFRVAKTSASVSAEVMKRVDELESKAVERCNADDDKRADQFVGEATKLLAK